METIRFWWIRNRDHAGLAIVLLLLAAILPFFVPLRRSTPRTGIVTRINVGGAAKLTPAFYAWVEIDGREIVVGLPSNHGCAVGSPIALQKAHTLSGERYGVSTRRCSTTASAPRVGVKPATARP
jgi:hypothetical protein